jgi:hypothetical protein
MANANGRNNRRYVRDNRALRDREPPYCTWPPCGELIDMSLPPTHPMSWTTDHTVGLAEGGDLFGPRTLMHRRCNSAKEAGRQQAQPRALRTTEEW